MNDKKQLHFTDKQGQYLAYIHKYLTNHGKAPAEKEMERFFGTTPPTIHQMILTLENKGFITRIPRQPRSIRLLVRSELLPILRAGKI